MKFLTIALFLLFSFSLVAQDEPCDAIPLTCNASPLTGNFDGTSLNPDLFYPCPDANSSNLGLRDIWFSFEADGENGYLFYSNQIGQGVDHVVALYTGPSCDDLTQIRQCHNEETFHDVFPEGTYYAVVRERLNNGTDNSYSAGLLCSPIPENDDPCNAILPVCGQEYTGSFIGSSFSDGSSCGSSLPYRDAGNVWFKIEADSSTTYNILGKLGQTVLLYEADSCTGELERLTDINTCGSQDRIGFLGEGTYYISLNPFQYNPTATLNYRLQIECGSAPVNGYATSALELDCAEPSVTGNTDFAPAEDRPCDSGISLRRSLWYKYQSDFEGDLELYACNYFIQAFTGTAENLVCLNQSGVFCANDPLTVNVSPNQDYFFRVEGFGGEFELVYSCQPSDFCPDLGFVGNPCSDNDPTTSGDVITVDCECIGDPIPAGALCQNAIPITQNPFSVNYYNPTFDDFPPYYHSINDIPPFLDSLGSEPFTTSCYVANDVVFSFTPNEDKFVDITASITNSNVEPNITILTGCPFTTAHVAEGCGTENFFVKKIENFHALADTTYYILIDGQPQLTGFDFNVDAQIQVVQKTFCPDLAAFQFDPCDDGNPITQDDMINENCECAGTLNPGEFCETAVELTPTPGLTVSPLEVDEGDATFSGLDQCSGVGSARDTWFYFDAVTTNMIVGAKGKFSAYDMVLEIYDECGESPLVCKDQKEGGKREIHLLTDCLVGERYYVRAYDGNGFSFFNKIFFIAVSSLPVTTLDESGCGITLSLTETISAEIPDYQYLITDWVFEFTQLEAPFNTIEFESPNGSSPEIILNQVPELEAGRNYDVRVKGAIQNGQIFGDYGEACTISVIGSSGISQFENGTVENSTNFGFEMFPNPNDGNEVVVSLKNLTNGQNEAHIRIYDFVGKLVMNHQVIGEGQQMTVQLPLVDLANGVYVVKITVNEKPLTAKKLVIR